MFGFGSKVKKVLKMHFLYSPGPLQKSVLDSVILQAKRKGVNEYDAAIMFMMVQMNSLEGSGSDVKSFVKTHSDNSRRILSLAKSDYSEIAEMLSIIESKHGLGLEEQRPVSNQDHSHSTFSGWLVEFKEKCGMYKSGLKPSKDGTSLIDFVDQAPLKRAFRDGVSPDTLAKEFAPRFDPTTFGRD